MSAYTPFIPSPELQTALKWIDGFNHWNIDQLLSVVADDYTHHVLPESLGIKPRSKAEWKEYFTGVMHLLQNFKVTIQETIESPGKVFFHAKSTATSTTGAPYANEYNLVLHLTPQPDGLPKISLVKEFVDSNYSVEFFAAERKRQAAKQEAKV